MIERLIDIKQFLKNVIVMLSFFIARKMIVAATVIVVFVGKIRTKPNMAR